MDVGSAGILPSAAYEIFLWTAPSSALVLPPAFPPRLPFPSSLSEGPTGWLLQWSLVGEWGGEGGAGGGGGGGMGMS